MALTQSYFEIIGKVRLIRHFIGFWIENLDGLKSYLIPRYWLLVEYQHLRHLNLQLEKTVPRLSLVNKFYFY